MVGTQDVSEFNRRRRFFFKGKKSLDILFNQLRVLSFVALLPLFRLFCCLLSLVCSVHVLCLSFMEEFSVLEFQNLKSQVFKFLVVFVCRSM
jgi:hypothetical protein